MGEKSGNLTIKRCSLMFMYFGGHKIIHFPVERIHRGVKSERDFIIEDKLNVRGIFNVIRIYIFCRDQCLFLSHGIFFIGTFKLFPELLNYFERFFIIGYATYWNQTFFSWNDGSWPYKSVSLNQSRHAYISRVARINLRMYFFIVKLLRH